MTQSLDLPTLSPTDTRAALADARDRRDRAYAALTLAEADLKAAALNVNVSVIDAAVAFHKATRAAENADRAYADAEAADLIANPPAAEIADAERRAQLAVHDARVAAERFYSAVDADALTGPLRQALIDAEAELAESVEGLRDVVRAAAEADPDMTGGQGCTKAAVIQRPAEAEITDAQALVRGLTAYSLRDKAAAEAAYGVIRFDTHRLAVLIANGLDLNGARLYRGLRVQVTAGRLTKADK